MSFFAEIAYSNFIRETQIAKTGCINPDCGAHREETASHICELIIDNLI
jgi:hypothetical protein